MPMPDFPNNRGYFRNMICVGMHLIRIEVHFLKGTNFISFRFGFLAVCLALATQMSAQGTVRDTSLFDPHVTISYAYQIPGGDLAARFGNNSNLALGFCIKSRSNWYYGVQGQFLFGNKVIQEEGFLQNLMVDGSYVLDNDGYPATLVLMERGFAVSADAGRLVPIIGPNRNSGILVKAGAGFLQHKIRIEHQETKIAQLDGEYGKGYDRMANGPAITGFVGYYHMSNNRLINFILGIEGWRAFTEPRRSINFDTQISENGIRNDVLLGIRAGWTLHLYKRMSDNFYYY